MGTAFPVSLGSLVVFAVVVCFLLASRLVTVSCRGKLVEEQRSLQQKVSEGSLLSSKDQQM